MHILYYVIYIRSIVPHSSLCGQCWNWRTQRGTCATAIPLYLYITIYIHIYIYNFICLLMCVLSVGAGGRSGGHVPGRRRWER